MAEYIDRKDAIEAVKHAWAKGLDPTQYIEIIPTADVAPVQHGRWQVSDNEIAGTIVRCSVCRMKHTCNVTLEEFAMFFHYCQNCGAKMDGGYKNATGDN